MIVARAFHFSFTVCPLVGSWSFKFNNAKLVGTSLVVVTFIGQQNQPCVAAGDIDTKKWYRSVLTILINGTDYAHYLQLKLLSGKNSRAWDSMDFT